MNDLIWHMIRRNKLVLSKTYIRNIDKWVLSRVENNIQYLYCKDLRVEDMEMDLLPSWWGYDCTKVEMLLINVEACNSVEVPNAFFEKKTSLQVLSLSSNNPHPRHSLNLQSSSLQSLANMRSLLLSHWKLHDISILGKLQSLDTLDFDDCSIYEFPKEISTLKLRLLSLKRCQIEMNNPFEVIERCLSLQELYYKDNEVSILHGVNEAEEIYQSGKFHGLNRYHLQGGEDDSISKCVCLPRFDVLVSKATFKYLIQGAEILHLKEIKGEWRNLIPEIVSSMNDVFELSLESCSKVESLVNTEHNESPLVSAFSKLTELKLAHMDNLKELWSGGHPSNFLESLKKLSLEHCVHLQDILFKSKVNLYNLKSVNLFYCQQLTSLFQLSTAQSLVRLEELRIRECKLLTNIIEDENDPKSNGLIFPKLETVEIEGCSKLFNISVECCPLLAPRVKRSSPTIGFKAKQQDPSKDPHHKLRSASRIKIPVEGGQIEGPMSSILSSECPSKQSPGLNIVVVHNIKQLVLKDLDKIKYIFTLSTASSMKLEILIVDSCDLLKHIIDIGDGCDGKNFDVFRELKVLSVSSCNRLECMFGGYAAQDGQSYNKIHIHLPTLKKLSLQELPKFSLSSMTWTSLKEFVLIKCPDFIINPISDIMIHSDSRKLVSTTTEDIREINKHFLTLETLIIKGYEAESVFCVSGVEIIGQVRLGLQCLKLSDLPRMLSICVGSRSSFFFQNLKTIQIVGCAKLKVIFLDYVLRCLPELKVLEIQDCEKLEQIIEEDKELGNVDSQRPCFPELEVLEVKQCHKLKSLIPASDVPHVKTIRIENCDRLKVIFSACVLRCLPELEVLEIQDCGNLQEIIEKEDKKLGNVDSPHPCFPMLEVLVVEQCHALESLNPASHVPNVKTIRIENCNRLEVIFPACVLRCLPELKVLEIQDCWGLMQLIEEDKELGNVDSPRPCFPKLEVLIVIECSNMESLIPTHDVPNVKTIRIENCNVLEIIFPNCVLRCLPELEVLEIQDCWGLEQIIEEDKNSRRPCFPKLAVLVIVRCFELKHLFSATNDVPNLELLIITDAYELEELMGGSEQRQGDDVLIGKIKVELPKLKIVIFVDLPEATFKEGIELQSVRHRFVHECPKLSLKATTTFKDIKEKVHELFNKDLKILLDEEQYEDMLRGDEIVQSDVAQTVSGSDLHSSQSEIGLNQSETCTDKQNEGDDMNIQDFKDDDLISLFQSVEEDGGGKIPPPSVSVITEDNLAVDILADLEKSLKMPLKDIASSEANTLHCLKALNFLSHLPLEDETLSDGLKAIIESLHQEFLNILHSFKKAFATINNFAVLEEKEKSIKEELARQNGIAISLVSKISKAKNNMEEAQQKKANLKEQIIDLEKEIQDLHERVDGRSMSESCLINQQKPLGETEITTKIPQCLKEKKDQSIQGGSEIENTIIKRHVEEGTTSNNAKVETSLTLAESASSQFGTSVTSQPKSNLHSEIELKQVFADLEESLKMPLNDIASSEGKSLRFLKALNFLSHLPLEDVTLSDGCKAIIDSLCHEFPIILCSFKQAFAITKKFAVLGPRLNEVTTMLVSKISKAKNFMGESQKKEETLKEEIIRLEKATTDVPVGPKAQTKSRIDLPSSRVSFNQSMQANLAGYSPNNNGIKMDDASIASPNSIVISEESKMELVGKVPDSEIPATTTSPTDLKLIESPSSSPSDNTLHKTHLHELVDGRRMNESCLMNQQKSIGETECTTEIPQRFQKLEHQSTQEGSESEKTVTTTDSSYSKTRNTLAGPSLVPFQMSIERGVEEGTTSDDAKVLTLSTNSETATSQPGPLVTTDSKSYPHREIKHSQNEISTDKDSEGQIHTPSVSDVIADNSFVKILADLEESLKMPLKDIACIEANNNPLLVGLSFLSHLPLEDATPSHALDFIVSMHKELPTILFSFKQVFAAINKVAVLKPHLNELATKLVSRISKTKNCIDEARKKEATLKEHIILLEKEIKHCEDGLSSLQEEKKKCIAETIGYKKEYENVKKEKSKMLEDQSKARKELLEVDYRWSDLCSQFQLNRFAARNPS